MAHGHCPSHCENTEPGPSHINLATTDDDSDMDVEITDADKCCVYKKFTPDEVRHSVSVIFTKCEV